MNGSKTFWADLSKKGGTWAAVAAAASAVCAWEAGGIQAVGDSKHVVIGLGIAALRAVLGLAQGKVGDPSTAKFDKHPASADVVDEEGL